MVGPTVDVDFHVMSSFRTMTVSELARVQVNIIDNGLLSDEGEFTHDPFRHVE
jgi:hypothetical protein